MCRLAELSLLWNLFLRLVTLSRLIDWRPALTIVKPDTLIRWHRNRFRLFWWWIEGARPTAAVS
jgi:hypothetical protein